MKKKLFALAMVVLVFAAVALVTGGSNSSKPDTDTQTDTPNTMVPSLMVDGVLYRISPTSDDYLEKEPDPASYLGSVTSQVPISQMPTKDGESNCHPVGSVIAACEKGIAVRQEDGAWRIFVPATTEE